MTMKKTLLIILFCLSFIASCGGGTTGNDSGTIQGNLDLTMLNESVSTGVNKSISGNMGAIVAVAGTRFFDATDANGRFEISNVPEGSHRLFVFALRGGIVHRYIRNAIEVIKGSIADLGTLDVAALMEQMEEEGFSDEDILEFLSEDSDGDGVPDYFDAFPNDPTEITDLDGDGAGDGDDDFPDNSGESEDSDNDGQGDNEDNDGNNDGITDEDDEDSNDGISDSDGDGINDNSDNCSNTTNASQADCDGDGIGGACDEDEIGAFVENVSGHKYVYEHITIGSGQTMTIAAGSRIEFCKGKGIYIASGGTLNIAGTSDNKVTLTSKSGNPNAVPGTVEWNGIYAFDGASGGTWTHVNFEYAGFDYAPIYLVDGNYTISDVQFDYCRGWTMVFRSAVTGAFSNWTITSTNHDIYPRLNLCSVAMTNFTTIGQSNGMRVDYGNNAISNVTINDARCAGLHLYAVTGGTFSDITVSGGGSGESCIPSVILGNAVTANTNTNISISNLTINGGSWTNDVYIESGSSLGY